MSGDGGVERPGVTPRLPRSIWVVAWASLAGQVLLVARHGGRVGDDAEQAVSMVLGALLVGFVAAGVVRARRVRVVLAWIVLTLSLLGWIALLVSADAPGQIAYAVLQLVAGAVSLIGLASFRRSEWYAWQRSRPPRHEGPSIGRLVAIGVLVGTLGGYVGLVDEGTTMRVDVDV